MRLVDKTQGVTAVATIISKTSTDIKEVEWHGWIRRNRHAIKKVCVTERTVGGANVVIEADHATLVETWGSFELACRYFGPRKGWQGTRILQHADKLFINNLGVTTYSTEAKWGLG